MAAKPPPADTTAKSDLATRTRMAMAGASKRAASSADAPSASKPAPKSELKSKAPPKPKAQLARAAKPEPAAPVKPSLPAKAKAKATAAVQRGTQVASKPDLQVDGAPVTSERARAPVSEYRGAASPPPSPSKKVVTTPAPPAPKPKAVVAKREPEVSTRPLTALEKLRLLGGMQQKSGEPDPAAVVAAVSSASERSPGTNIREVAPKPAAIEVPKHLVAGRDAGNAVANDGFIAGVRTIDPDTAARAAAEARFLAQEQARAEQEAAQAQADAAVAVAGPEPADETARTTGKKKSRKKAKAKGKRAGGRSRAVSSDEVIVVDGTGAAAERPAVAFSSKDGVISPEELLAMLGAEREGESLGSDAPPASRDASASAEAGQGEDPKPSRRAGAAIIEMQADRKVGRKSTAATSTPKQLSTDSMISGVRDLGRVPIGATSLPTFSEGADARERSMAVARAPRDPHRVRFARGASQVFDRGELSAGLEVVLSLPVREGTAHGIDVRITQVGTDRELRQLFSAPPGAVQAAPSVTMSVPRDWLRAGRFTIEVSSPAFGSDAGSGASARQRMNLRVLGSAG